MRREVRSLVGLVKFSYSETVIYLVDIACVVFIFGRGPCLEPPLSWI